MKSQTACLCLSFLALSACTTAPPASAPQSDVLTGTWKVDLRAKPSAPAYFQSFSVTRVVGNTFEGSFYNTPITEGRINTSWGAVRIAFVTADGSGTYHHSAVLTGAKLEGLTNATTRGFLAYWSAVKE